MGIGFPEPTAVVAADVNCHNYDASIGTKGQSESLAVTLCTEDKATLAAIAGGGMGTPVVEYDENASVAGNSTVTVVTYTVPAGKKFVLRHAAAAGNNIATYRLKINGSVVDQKFSYYTNLNVDFFFESSVGGGLTLNAGDIALVEVTNIKPYSGDFNGTIFGQVE